MRKPPASIVKYRHFESYSNWGEDDSRHMISFRLQWHEDCIFSQQEETAFVKYAWAWCKETFGRPYKRSTNVNGTWYSSAESTSFYFKNKKDAMLFKVAMCE